MRETSEDNNGSDSATLAELARAAKVLRGERPRVLNSWGGEVVRIVLAGLIAAGGAYMGVKVDVEVMKTRLVNIEKQVDRMQRQLDRVAWPGRVLPAPTEP